MDQDAGGVDHARQTGCRLERAQPRDERAPTLRPTTPAPRGESRHAPRRRRPGPRPDRAGIPLAEGRPRGASTRSTDGGRDASVVIDPPWTGGSAWESNPPRDAERRATGVEDRGAHRDPSAPTADGTAGARERTGWRRPVPERAERRERRVTVRLPPRRVPSCTSPSRWRWSRSPSAWTTTSSRRSSRPSRRTSTSPSRAWASSRAPTPSRPRSSRRCSVRCPIGVAGGSRCSWV